jgi:hypothetical protein
MVEILIGHDVNGLSPSKRAVKYMAALGLGPAVEEIYNDYEQITGHYYCNCLYDIKRTDRKLISVFKFLGKEFSDRHTALIIIPDNVEWGIQESESGSEHVYERHRHWFDVDGKTKEEYY